MAASWQHQESKSILASCALICQPLRLLTSIESPLQCRSLRELRKAVKAKIKPQEQPVASCTSSEQTTAYVPGREEDEVVSKLTAAIGGMHRPDSCFQELATCILFQFSERWKSVRS